MDAFLDETWRQIPFAVDGCEASDFGRVRTRKRTGWHVLTGYRHRDGYLQYSIRMREGHYKKWFAHRLVAATFLGDRPFGAAEVRHLDGDPLNNVVANLAYGTRAQNAHDMVRHGRSTPGVRHANALLTESQVREIVQLWAWGMRPRDIGEQYRVSRATVELIVTGQTWGGVTGLAPLGVRCAEPALG